jgi:hypothetical protein
MPTLFRLLPRQSKEKNMSKPDVVVVSVSRLARLDGDKEIPITAQEYQHTECHIPSRNVRGMRHSREFQLGIVDGVPKRPTRKHPPPNGGEKEVENGKGSIPTCNRDTGILVEFDEKHGVLKVNRNNPKILSTFSAAGIRIRSGDLICKYAASAYHRLKSLATSIHNHCQLIEVKVGDEFWRDDADPRYLSNSTDFLINRILTDYFEQDPGMIELRDGIARERAKLESQLRTVDDQEDAATA